MEQSPSIFWSWFKKNNNNFLNLNDHTIKKEIREEYLDEILYHLHEFCANLYFEIGGWPNQEQELIITADGKVDYFEKVEELINNAPIIENWTFTAFIQPRELDYTSNFEDVELKPLDAWILPMNKNNDPKAIGFKVCVPNYDKIKKSKWLDAAICRMLDTTLGEKVFTLDVDFIEVGTLPDNPAKFGMIELKELPAFIRWKKSKLS